MWNRAPIFLIFIAYLLWGCRNSHVNQQLDLAEAVMEERPDSALDILRHIDGYSLRGEPQARHALLLSQAYDKNYIDLTSDSLISIACDHYSRSKDERRKMLALHYRATIARHAERYGSALRDELQAYDLAVELQDTLNMARCESGIAWLYGKAKDYRSAMKWDKQALKHAKRMNKPEWLHNAYCSLAESSVSMLDYDQALAYADSALAIDTYPQDRPLDCKYLAYWGKEDFNKANAVLKALKDSGAELSANIKAIEHFSKERTVEEEIAYLNKVIEEQNREILQITANNLNDISVLHQRAKAEQLHAAVETKRTENITIVSVALLTIIALITIVLAIRWKAASNRAKLEVKIGNLSAEYSRLKSEMENRENPKNVLSSAFLKKFSWIEKIGSLYLDSEQSQKNAALLYDRIRREIDKSKGKKFILEVEKNMQATDRALWEEISSLGLTPTEKEILIYLLCGVSTRVISMLTEKSPSSIYMTKTRIKAKIEAQDSSKTRQISKIVQHN